VLSAEFSSLIDSQKWELNRAKVVPSGTITPNLVSGNYAGAAAKNPYPRRAQFELAPLAKPGK